LAARTEIYARQGFILEGWSIGAQNDQSVFYEEVFRKLNESGIRYLVAGGMAVNLHGVPRLTQDLDLLIDLDRENILKTIDALMELGYRVRLPVNPADFAEAEIRHAWIEEKNMKVFSFFHRDLTWQGIDLMFDVPVSYQEASSDMVVKQAGDLMIPIASINVLIKLKENVGRKQDISDIRMLREIQKLEEEDGGA
jgi:hypothetical protein